MAKGRSNYLNEREVLRVLPPNKIVNMTNYALSQVNETLSEIEKSFESYNKLTRKEAIFFKENISSLKQFHDKLSDWERKVIEAKSNGDFFRMYSLLQNLIDLCEVYPNKSSN